MAWYYWLIVLIPLGFIIAMGIYSARFVRGVADYLAAGRVAGRYVLSVGAMEGGLGVISLVAGIEMQYQTGFAMGFWGNVLLPVGMLLSLTGFINYRLRETKVLSMGQFLEMRYSRSFRIFSMSLRTFSEMLCNCIGPAVTARFFIYMLGLPPYAELCGVRIQTFLLLIIGLLILANILILTGGTISLMVTDCVQGLFCYPLFVVFTIFVLAEFSWFGEITPVMNDRITGESFLNPYDIQRLRDFNLFALVVSIFTQFLNRGVWFGGGASSAAKSAHEQKMVGILSSFRTGFSTVMPLLMAVAVITFMTHKKFSEQAHKTRTMLIEQTALDTVSDPGLRKEVVANIKTMSPVNHELGKDIPLSRKTNLDTPYLNNVHQTLLAGNPDNPGYANSIFQNFSSIYHQMMMPVVFRNIMPPFLLALFVLFGIMLMVSTDNSRIFSSAMTIAQDLILPLKKEPFTPKQHIRCIRWMTVLVSICFVVGSMYLSQMDYINLFCIISTAIWCGGAGSVITFGLYSKYGTTAGAYAAILTGAVISGGGMILQYNWANTVYPFLDLQGWIPALSGFLSVISAPFNPYIVWEMNSVKFPINSTELLFLSMLFSIFMYWSISFLTFKKTFNLDRMLHRGIYNIDGENKNRAKFTCRTLLSYFVSITPEYTRGDKIIAWSFFGYTFIYQFLLCFIGVAIWNVFSPWPMKWWGGNFFITSLLVPAIIGIISTFWFFIGGVIDMKRLFHDLARRQEDPLDNGQVEGSVSLNDLRTFQEQDIENKE